MTGFQDRVALITGADRGIGRALGRRLGSEGCRLVLHSHNAEGLHKAVAEEGWSPGQVLTAVHDVADAEAVEASVAEAIERFGRIDYLLNVAGVAHPGGALSTSKEVWDATLSTNLTGYFVAARAVLPHMRRAGEGFVVNMSSIWGRRASAPGGGLAYSVSKWGVEGLTKGLAEEARPWGVRVSGIVLDKVDTLFGENMPVTLTEEQRARMMSTEDVADATVAILTSSPRVHVSTVELDAWQWGR
ncbi:MULTISPECIES: SDR family oxidoreductase [unclassified Streptomyces]|uniref:SDR family oxidoreductase n=1 Tax=unclassified Streptomyces TaxID=2593676 RepID=UPI0013D9EC57|nr:SDR family oxidoreductase [Streptomyces sp. OM5714]KAF2776489.1 short-chain dehydrogenase/reductase sdr [Streptomyces sp. OM5714]